MLQMFLFFVFNWRWKRCWIIHSRQGQNPNLKNNIIFCVQKGNNPSESIGNFEEFRVLGLCNTRVSQLFSGLTITKKKNNEIKSIITICLTMSTMYSNAIALPHEDLKLGLILSLSVFLICYFIHLILNMITCCFICFINHAIIHQLFKTKEKKMTFKKEVTLQFFSPSSSDKTLFQEIKDNAECWSKREEFLAYEGSWDWRNAIEEVNFINTEHGLVHPYYHVSAEEEDEVKQNEEENEEENSLCYSDDNEESNLEFDIDY